MNGKFGEDYEMKREVTSLKSATRAQRSQRAHFKAGPAHSGIFIVNSDRAMEITS